jgi:hypothetical protein
MLRLVTMLRLGATCAVKNSAVRFQYCGGVLHSANDEPALVVKTAPRKHSLISKPGALLSGPYIRVVNDVHDRTEVWYVRDPPKVKLQSSHTESLWYAWGDTHRDFGPAVVGNYCDLKLGADYGRYWYKYHRGVQAAAHTNTYTG